MTLAGSGSGNSFFGVAEIFTGMSKPSIAAQNSS